MYKILNENGTLEILLYSLIEGGHSAGSILKALRSLQPSDKITLRINSDGGEIFDAIALYNYLSERDVDVMIDGVCASAASIVAMAGKTITMKPASMFMIHNPATLAFGDSDTLKGAAEVLDKLTEQCAAIYSARTGLSVDAVKDLMANESWMTAQEALAQGFVDAIDDTPAPTINTAPALPAIDPADDANDSFNMGIEAGIKAERERLRELDEIMTPERAAIINRAKYETGQRASDIALSILRAGLSASLPPVNSLKAGSTDSTIFEAIGETISKLRGKH